MSLFRSRFDGKQHEHAGISCKDATRTKQSFRDECDINNILKKYLKTGQLPDLIRTDAKYGDFSSMGSYQESLNLVLHAQEQFAALPAHVRDRFQNDASRFLAFAEDPKNAKEMVDMGLATVRETNVSETPSRSSKGGSKKSPDPKGQGPAAGDDA